MGRVENQDGHLQGTDLFEMKYFLTGKQRREHDAAKASEVDALNAEISGSAEGARQTKASLLQSLTAARTIYPHDYAECERAKDWEMERNYGKG